MELPLASAANTAEKRREPGKGIDGKTSSTFDPVKSCRTLRGKRLLFDVLLCVSEEGSGGGGWGEEGRSVCIIRDDIDFVFC